ncbi:MAG: cytochrome c oxidase subunit II, partial [Chloroflexota bacterium]|nr:cytochrome c oxidase subunit II [Chloroflexota bacterium]
MPQPQSPFAQDIANLYNLVLIIAAGILLLVTGLVLYMIVRFRDRGAGGEPRPNFGDRRLEIAWTVAPALILVVVLALTIPTMASETPDPPVAPQTPFLQVTGHQFWWEVVYPQAGVRTANEIHIPTGQRLLVELHAADVIHDFWVPALGPKMDMIPGQTNYMWLQADHPGIYQGECAEFCGAEHAWMRFQVVAEPQAAWAQWAAAQHGPAAPVAATANLTQG